MKTSRFLFAILHLFAPALVLVGGNFRAKGAEGSTNPPPANTFIPGIVAWWPLQGNGADVSGRGHPLVLEGDPLFGDGEVGQSILLDGGNDYARVAPHSDLDLGSNDGLTIELWINPANTASQQPLVEWSDDTSTVGLHFWTSVESPWAGGGPRSLFANVIDRDGVAHHVSSAPGVIASNAFTHVALTYSKISGLAKLYANGRVVANTNIGSLTPETRAALYVGWRPLGGGQYRFAGKLDEITLYSRELTQPELNSIFQAGSAGKTPATNPPPPVVHDFNLSRDFSVLGNPNGVWSYGHVPSLGGPFTLMNTARTNEAPSIPIWSWSVNGNSSPDVHYNASSSNVFTADGGTFPPHTLWASPGHESSSNTFAVMRFTSPSNGVYDVRATARSFLDASSGDTDYHVVKNGAELFGVFLPAGAQSTGYSNTLSLSMGDTLDFVVGRGQDGQLFRSALKLEAVITPTTNAPSGTNPPPPVVGLISLWRGDNNAQDAAGTNHGVIVNNVGFAPGVSGQAFRLDGTNFIRVPNSLSLRLTNEFTFQMWFKRDTNLPFGTSFTLFDKRDLARFNYGANLSQNYGTQLYYNDPTYSGIEIIDAPLVSAGVWHHFAGTYRQKTNGVELMMYIDGALVATNTLPGTLSGAANSAPLAIGSARDGASDYFKGLIDEVAIYNYALSASQVMSNYNEITSSQASVTTAQGPRMSAKGFELWLNPQNGSNFVIEVSEDLVRWISVTNIVCSGQSSVYYDPQATGHEKRFYRVRPISP